MHAQKYAWVGLHMKLHMGFSLNVSMQVKNVYVSMITTAVIFESSV